MAASDALTAVEHPDPQAPAHATSPTFCVRLWQHMHLQASGELLACCLHRGGPVRQDGVAVSANRQSLMEIWNADTLRELRRAMVEGQRVTGCEMCYAAEERGGESIRQLDNRKWESNWSNEPRATIDEMIASAIDNDFHVPKLPSLIDIQATSLCNLKCRMCVSTNSSKIAKDAVQRSWEPPEHFPRDNPAVTWLRSIENLAGELAKDAGSEVRELSFAGGEPLLLREIPRLLERLIAIGRAPFLSMQFVSNGTVVPRWLALAQKFRRFDLQISVDGYADDYDYIRFPGRWSKLANHFQLFKTVPGIYLLATTTIQVNNVLRLTDLFRYLDSIDINFVGYLLHRPSYLAVDILPASIRRVAAARLLEYAEADCRPQQRELVRSFAAQIEAGGDTGDSGLLRDFMLYTNDLDASRGQSIHRTDPELVELLEQAGFPWLHETVHAAAAGVADETRRWRRTLVEARNTTAKLRRELSAAIQVLPDESTRPIDAPAPTEEPAARARRELSRARNDLAAAYASRSWRLTRPLRAAGRRLRRWRQASSEPHQPATG